MTDEQTLALVEAAQTLSRPYQGHDADTDGAGVSGRLLRLEWAVRAGRTELAARAAHRPVPPAARAATAQAQGHR